MTKHNPTIKETAGKILLLLYYKQRQNPILLKNEILSFDSSVSPEDDSFTAINKGELVKLMRKVIPDDALLYNSLYYLFEKDFVDCRRTLSQLDGQEDYYGLHVTADGIDVIEEIEHEVPVEKKRFGPLFNVVLSSTINVDSLIKAEIGDIIGLKASIL